jgi:hypothetical protein
MGTTKAAEATAATSASGRQSPPALPAGRQRRMVAEAESAQAEADARVRARPGTVNRGGIPGNMFGSGN